MDSNDFSTEDQFAWDMSVSAINTGKLLRYLGLSVSALVILVGITTAGFYIIEIKGTIGFVGALSALIAIVPMFAGGQFLSLYGTRGILHGIQVQNEILDRDITDL